MAVVTQNQKRAVHHYFTIFSEKIKTVRKFFDGVLLQKSWWFSRTFEIGLWVNVENYGFSLKT